MAIIKINVYRDGSDWYGARWIDGEYDGCDALGISADASESEAIEAAQTMPLTVAGQRVVSYLDSDWYANPPSDLSDGRNAGLQRSYGD